MGNDFCYTTRKKIYICKKCNLEFFDNKVECTHHVFKNKHGHKRKFCLHCNVHRKLKNNALCYHKKKSKVKV